MARAGRKRKPTALRVVDGQQDAVERDDPAEMPTKPNFLHPYAIEEWDRITPTLFELGILTSLDRAAIAGYCQAVARWRFAEEKLAAAALGDDATGALVATTDAGNKVQSVLLTVANGAMRDMLKFAAEFGMTPSARARIEGKRGEAADPIARKYF